MPLEYPSFTNDGYDYNAKPKLIQYLLMMAGIIILTRENFKSLTKSYQSVKLKSIFNLKINLRLLGREEAFFELRS